MFLFPELSCKIEFCPCPKLCTTFNPKRY